MSILVTAETRVICQGITGAFGAQHTQGCLHYGTRLVGGVTPGKGGTKDANGLPVFDTVEKAVRETGATATMIFVPPGLAADAILEAAAAGIPVICAITEGVPVQDMIKVRAVLDEMNAAETKRRRDEETKSASQDSGSRTQHPNARDPRQSASSSLRLSVSSPITLVGPNCPGIITPGPKTGSGSSAADPYTK